MIAATKAKPLTIKRWFSDQYGCRSYEMIITPSEHTGLFASCSCSIDGIEVPAEVFNMALRLAGST